MQPKCVKKLMDRTIKLLCKQFHKRMRNFSNTLEIIHVNQSRNVAFYERGKTVFGFGVKYPVLPRKYCFSDNRLFILVNTKEKGHVTSQD